MQIQPTALTPAPSPGGGASAGAPAEPGGFAKILSAQQPPPAARPPRTKTDAAAPKAPAEAAAEPTEPTPSATATPGTTPPTIDTALPVPDTHAGIHEAPLAAEVLAALNRPLPSPTAPVPAGDIAMSAPTPSGELQAASGVPAALDTGRARRTAHEPARPGAADTKPAETSTPFAESVRQAAQDAVTQRADDVPRRIDFAIEPPRPIELPQALAAAAPAARPDSASASAPVAVAMPTPATAPEFRQALGVQVSVLARDGVQHAELHLNPAEMGPISVQIALAGTQAQVDFGAESAATRQIIESGLPELASALREAGFTLTGGGVSQHPRGRSHDGTDGHAANAGSRRGVDGEAAEPALHRLATRLPLGAVDLYA
jgi:flagellar hook-length control protein FliK